VKILSRHEEAIGEKCPNCLDTFCDFKEVLINNEVFYQCFTCGLVFRPKVYLVEERRQRKSVLERQLKEKSFKCSECNRICGSKAGLKAHMRAHERS